jgi:hypothetical protein
LITEECFAKVPLLGRSRIRAIDHIAVRGRSAEITVMEVMWDRGRAVTTIVPPIQRTQIESGRVDLHYDGRTFTVAQQSNPLVIGRGASCQLAVNGKKTSRQHAAVEWRRGKFVLADRSTNGTFVWPDGGQVIHLRREEFVLQGTGLIGFGEQPREGGAAVVRYACK